MISVVPVRILAPSCGSLFAVGVSILAAAACWADPGQSYQAAQHHWAYQPLARPTPPQGPGVQSPVDAFLLAKLSERHLSFAPPADRRTLLRRVYYDLIGLPPTADEVQTFEQDQAPNAFARVVDELLASPRYGERWGRHWLDVARYADTKDLVLAYGKDALRPYAYTYRDYVIRAFNEDLPFDQFVRDQLAADLLGPQHPRWRLAALGFLTLGRLFDNNPHDQIDDQIDTTTRGFLALTVACARCHDHKYDAITQADYYGLYGVFASTERPYDLPLLEDPKTVPGGVDFERRLAKARQELENQIDDQFAQLTEAFRQKIGQYLLRAGTTEPDITETSQFALSLTPEDLRPTLLLRTRRWLKRRAVTGDRLFGPWSDLMALPEEGFAAGAAKVLSQASNGAQPYNPLVLAALRSTALTNKASVALSYGNLLQDVYAQFRKASTGSNTSVTPDQSELLQVVIGPDGPIWFPRRDTPVHMSRPDKDRYNGLVAELDKIAASATNPPPARAMIVADLPEPYEPHIFRRGNPARMGDPVPRAFVRLLTGGTARPFTQGSGRLELAEAITARTNPLTARVFVNRVWMHHFGEPLVSSPSDFGSRSDPPSNPALLDWLASEFIRSGWSIKHLHRVMLLTAAYQQSSAPPNAADPENKLLSHFPRRRLDFEAMRDSLLFVSGRLNLSLGGRSVDLTTDPLSSRRTVYALVNRQDLPSMFRAFDFPVPDQCIERRAQTSVPQQALFAMNSPFVLEQARALAGLPAVVQTVDPALRVGALFQRVLARQPTASETASSLRFIQAAEQEPLPDLGLTAWEQLAQVLLMANESAFVD